MYLCSNTFAPQYVIWPLLKCVTHNFSIQSYKWRIFCGIEKCPSQGPHDNFWGLFGNPSKIQFEFIEVLANIAIHGLDKMCAVDTGGARYMQVIERHFEVLFMPFLWMTTLSLLLFIVCSLIVPCDYPFLALALLKLLQHFGESLFVGRKWCSKREYDKINSISNARIAFCLE